MSTQNLGPVVKHNIRLEYDATWEYEASLDDDAATSELAYEDDFEGWEKRLPILGSEHPDIRNMSLVKIKAKLQEGGKLRVFLSYVSTASDVPGFQNDSERVKRYGCEPSLSEEPILTFHKLSDLDEKSRTAIAAFLGSSRTQEDYAAAVAAVGSDPLGLLALEKIQKGQDAYRLPQMVWIQRRKLRSLGSLPTNKIGKIDTPPGDPPPGPTGSNWMYLAPKIEPTADGKAWNIEERWERSNENGWDTFFYEMEA